MLTEKTVDFILNLWEESGEPWVWPGNGRATSRGIARGELLANGTPEMADKFIQHFKDKKTVVKEKQSAGVQMASAKQISYGQSLDIKANGYCTKPWASATMADAWQWIKELKDAPTVGAR